MRLHCAALAAGFLFLAATAHAQQDPRSGGLPGLRAAPHKSPMLARVIGIIPGAGHAYAGEGRRGLMFLGSMVGVAIIGGSVSDAQCPEDKYTDEYCSSQTLDVVTAVAVAGVWVWSIFDAGEAAKRTNRARFRLGSVRVPPMGVPGGSGTGSHPAFTASVSIAAW